MGLLTADDPDGSEGSQTSTLSQKRKQKLNKSQAHRPIGQNTQLQLNLIVDQMTGQAVEELS